MNMKKLSLTIKSIAVFALVLSLSSCLDDLDQSNPENASNPSAEELYSDPAAYQQTLAKLYAGLATTGQNGPAGQPDIDN
jgi:hypothetical protein